MDESVLYLYRCDKCYKIGISKKVSQRERQLGIALYDRPTMIYERRMASWLASEIETRFKRFIVLSGRATPNQFTTETFVAENDVEALKLLNACIDDEETFESLHIIQRTAEHVKATLQQEPLLAACRNVPTEGMTEVAVSTKTIPSKRREHNHFRFRARSPTDPQRWNLLHKLIDKGVHRERALFTLDMLTMFVDTERKRNDKYYFVGHRMYRSVKTLATACLEAAKGMAIEVVD